VIVSFDQRVGAVERWLRRAGERLAGHPQFEFLTTVTVLIIKTRMKVRESQSISIAPQPEIADPSEV
jgi:hypothetical protein